MLFGGHAISWDGEGVAQSWPFGRHAAPRERERMAQQAQHLPMETTRIATTIARETAIAMVRTTADAICWFTLRTTADAICCVTLVVAHAVVVLPVWLVKLTDPLVGVTLVAV
jgi:hypothetical protein